MDSKPWWQSKTIWSAVISVLCGAIATTGHNIDPGTQVNLVNAVTAIADAGTIIFSALAAVFRSKATTTVTATKAP